MDGDIKIGSEELVARLQAALGELSPELRKAAAFVLENPREVGVSSVRGLAERAGVKPNTLVRLANFFDLPGYEAFRDVFRAGLLKDEETYQDRARWLQSLSRKGQLGQLFADSAGNAMRNVERFYGETDPAEIERAVETILRARRTFVLGVGMNYPVAHNFAYLAGMAMDGVVALPQGGILPVDGLARADERDMLIALTFRPYRREVLEAVAAAAEKGMHVLAVSDSPAAPIMDTAEDRFVIGTDTPQFFHSTVALAAFFEALLGFLVARGGPRAVASIESFHERRRTLGIYVQDS
ncbi:MAG: MurR/RpiR family transcriptional regulator [Pseudomonadota bacterium]